MRKYLSVLFCVFPIVVFYSQVPNISYTTPGIFTVNQTINNLVPVNSGGSIPEQPFVTTLAGSGIAGFVDETGMASRFNLPTEVAIDNQNNIIVVDRSNHRIRKITPSGEVTTIAGTGSIGSQDGPGNSATFNYPDGIAIDSQGNIFISDQSNHKIRKISLDGQVTTFAGSGVGGFLDGTGLTAKFKYPAGMSIDANDNLYVADYSNHKIRKITPAGVVTTIAGISAGNADGVLAVAKFNGPTGVCLDTFGNVYVADFNNHKIRKIDLTGNVSTYAGTGVAGNADGTALTASFNHPAIVVCDKENNLFVTDQTNHKVRKISNSGTVTTYAGTGISGANDDVANLATFNNLTGIAIGQKHTLYIADYGNHKIRKVKKYGYYITPALPSGLFMDWETGVISGTPTEISPLTNYVISVENQFGTSTSSLAIEIQGTLGTITPIKSVLNFYPNPVKDKFTISSVNKQAVQVLKIYNLLGQEVAIFQKMKMDLPIDVSFLQSGYYSCQIETEAGIKEIKFIKQ